MTEAPPLSPYDRIGGAEVVSRFVDRFYDLLGSDPRYAALRALHAPDLGPMRVSLAGFLTAWLGGPRDWFEARPGVCVMSAHAQIPIHADTARQWTDAMGKALADCGVDQELGMQINHAFARMSEAMVRPVSSVGQTTMPTSRST